MSSGEAMRAPDGIGHRYLGTLELDGILDREVKVKISKANTKRVKMVLKSNLNAKTFITTMNNLNNLIYFRWSDIVHLSSNGPKRKYQRWTEG